jgi:glycosyltransferase involved in cell wall biosynthesis
MPQHPELPAIAGDPIGVLLLAHEDAAHAEAVVRVWLGWLDRRGGDGELLVVDDASADGTAEKVQAITHPRLRVIRHESSKGEGAALRTGLAALDRPLIFYTLCRPEYTPEGLETMLSKTITTEDGKKRLEIDLAHLSSGSRAGVPVPGPLRALGWLWRMICWLVFSVHLSPMPGWLGWRRYLANVWMWTVFGTPYTDPLCPYRLLRRGIMARIPIQSDTAFAHAELLAKATFLGCIMAEQVPLPVSPPGNRGDFWPLYRDAMRVMNRPDFGPATLPAV